MATDVMFRERKRKYFKCTLHVRNVFVILFYGGSSAEMNQNKTQTTMNKIIHSSHLFSIIQKL